MRSLALLLKARGANLARELGRQKLDDYLAIQRRFCGEEQAAHAATTELLLNAAGVAEGGLQVSKKVAHGA